VVGGAPVGVGAGHRCSPWAPPDDAPVFIHRDYHPGNVLWSRGAVTGVVDWVNASGGGAGADVGHCRQNLAVAFDGATADEVQRLWQALAGVDEYLPYWDIVAVVGALSNIPRSPRARHRLDEFVCRAVAQL
jgi:aminoglycoside phosphotransferase (APT) family kinase protein